MAKMVFVSHSSADDQIVQRYADALKSVGISCWLDHENDIPAGSSYPKEIRKGIKESPLFLLFYSSNVNNEPDDILDEIETVKEKRKKEKEGTIIPVCLDNTEYSEDFKYYLSRIQRVDVASMDDDEAVRKVVHVVREKLAIELKLAMKKADELYSRKKYRQAIGLYRRCAEGGDAGAQYVLGMMYYDGNGVSRDYEMAAYWLSEAAEQRHPQAAYNLGRMYQYGRGVRELSKSKAMELYRAAAEDGDAEAQCCLAEMYYNEGSEDVKNLNEAFQWFSKAARHGCFRAGYFLGKMYEDGKGAENNMDDALKWYEWAAKHGVKEAQNRLNELKRGNGSSCLVSILRALIVILDVIGLALLAVIFFLLYR